MHYFSVCNHWKFLDSKFHEYSKKKGNNTVLSSDHCAIWEMKRQIKVAIILHLNRYGFWFEFYVHPISIFEISNECPWTDICTACVKRPLTYTHSCLAHSLTLFSCAGPLYEVVYHSSDFENRFRITAMSQLRANKCIRVLYNQLHMAHSHSSCILLYTRQDMSLLHAYIYICMYVKSLLNSNSICSNAVQQNNSCVHILSITYFIPCAV